MSRRRFVVLSIGVGFAAALGISGVLCQRSRSADFDAHARTVESIGRVRERTEMVSKQALAARFGLLNQYDPLVQAEAGLEAAEQDLRLRRTTSAAEDPELGRALHAPRWRADVASWSISRPTMPCSRIHGFQPAAPAVRGPRAQSRRAHGRAAQGTLGALG